jgi:hypothetical protein
MTVIINFNVRNPEWYWSAQEIKESGGYYEEWKMLNEDTVPKHVPCWGYKVGFDVNNIQENRNTSYDLKYSLIKDPSVTQTIRLDNMTYVTFFGENEKAEAVVSNEILHSFLGAKKSGRKYYWYFFIKENTEYEKLSHVLWLSKAQSLLLPG